MLTIAEHTDDAPSVKTIRFEESMTAAPGQFVMVWVPGVDEFPMSVSYVGERYGFTYQILGEGTKILAAKTPGDMIGIRGPYGHGFSIKGKRLLMVAGGLGMAPIAPFAEQAVEHRASVDLVIGAKSAANLLFEKRAVDAGAKVHIATDDGSKGSRGFASDIAAVLLQKEAFDAIYTCGPEPMIVKVLQTASMKGLPVQASLERLMKCGIGICDSCAIDGKHVCRDGPVFSEKDLRALTDLGRAKLDATGRKVHI
jgi:dihydroorotate dehydrogenase electron transfer subunit